MNIPSQSIVRKYLSFYNFKPLSYPFRNPTCKAHHVFKSRLFHYSLCHAAPYACAAIHQVGKTLVQLPDVLFKSRRFVVYIYRSVKMALGKFFRCAHVDNYKIRVFQFACINVYASAAEILAVTVTGVTEVVSGGTPADIVVVVTGGVEVSVLVVGVDVTGGVIDVVVFWTPPVVVELQLVILKTSDASKIAGIAIISFLPLILSSLDSLYSIHYLLFSIYY